MSRGSYVDAVMPDTGPRIPVARAIPMSVFCVDALSPQKGFVQTVANSH
jgi:hypothetical protein